jgi:hypothetical protein
MWNRNCLPFRCTWIHNRFLSVVRVARYLIFCVVFCISLFILLSLFLLVIALSVLRFTASGYPFEITIISFERGCEQNFTVHITALKIYEWLRFEIGRITDLALSSLIFTLIWVGDNCITPSEQFVSMARTSYISMIWRWCRVFTLY